MNLEKFKWLLLWSFITFIVVGIVNSIILGAVTGIGIISSFLSAIGFLIGNYIYEKYLR
ncbi:hypothetical protein Alsa1_CDS0187 [Staphylococcus phage Alsa_1]|nr:hypothetical protein Alsa1_CDS0187 [Staphylococcus phage Alsa_1]